MSKIAEISPGCFQLGELCPHVPKTCFLAPGAKVIGEVRLGEYASIWFNSVLRGDINYISVGTHTNIQDGSVLHVADDGPCLVGNYVTVGHNTLLHACRVEDECLIGMGAIILNGAVVGAGSMVAAGALVLEDFQIPPRSLVAGLPAKVVRPLSTEEATGIRYWAEKYVKVALRYMHST